jgi:hypothetical protein
MQSRALLVLLLLRRRRRGMGGLWLGGREGERGSRLVSDKGGREGGRKEG